MRTYKRNLLSLLTLSVFIFFAFASSVNKIHAGAFATGNLVEDKSEEGNYLVTTSGEKIFGDKIRWKGGALVKDQVQIDGRKFPMAEIRGYRIGDSYYGRLGHEYIKRIVHGKLNVYIQYSQMTTTETTYTGATRMKTTTHTYHYAQRGEDGPMVVFGSQKDIKELVKDCPLAVSMADLSNKQMRRAIKKNRSYLNNIFEVYNNDCRDVRF